MIMATHTLPKIYGISSCSEAADNIFAPSIFLFGCNLRCPYCMNTKAVIANPEIGLAKEIPFDEIKGRLLEDVSGWVMISGGEPLLTPAYRLHALLTEIKSWGKKIGISTNGTLPDVLNMIIDEKFSIYRQC